MERITSWSYPPPTPPRLDSGQCHSKDPQSVPSMKSLELSAGSQTPVPTFLCPVRWKRPELFSAAFPTLPQHRACVLCSGALSPNKAILMRFCSADGTGFRSDYSEYYFTFQGCHGNHRHSPGNREHTGYLIHTCRKKHFKCLSLNAKV